MTGAPAADNHSGAASRTAQCSEQNVRDAGIRRIAGAPPPATAATPPLHI